MIALMQWRMRPRFLSMLQYLMMLAFMLLQACSTPTPADYQSEIPTLNLRAYFTGETEAFGMVQDRQGKVIKRFKVRITGTQQDDALILDEHFTYSDGSQENRLWTLTEKAPGQWQGQASDVIGVAQGQVAGNALNWRYTLALPVDGTIYHVQFDDWMFLLDQDRMMNRARMSKLGVELAQVTIFFHKIKE
jgi:hypothetical protein